jgi:anaerobic magnesium-protoporphyrin IX monomethyl ester cyclase
VEINSIMLLRVASATDKVDHPQFFDPPYTLKYLQAGLQQDPKSTVHLLDCWISPGSVSHLLDYTASVRPDMVVVSSASFDVDVSNTFVAALKKHPEAPLVIGIGQGHYLNRDTKNGCEALYDVILLGEPEEEFFELLSWLRRSNTSDESWKAHYHQHYAADERFAVRDPDLLPFPSYTPAELNAYKSIFPVQLRQRVVWGFLIATRGCPYPCNFCSEVMRVSTGTKIRGRSAANVADEMAHLERQGVNICSFQDDSFSSNRRFVRALCEELIARNSTMPWMARVRADEVDYDLLALMKQARCIMLGMGVEAGTQRIIDVIQKNFKPKPWLDRCRQAFRWARELGMGTNAYYIIGNPTETREEIEQTIRFAQELNSDTIQVHFYTPYPGSAAWEKYVYQLRDYDLTNMFHYATPVFPVAAVSPEELVQLRARFYRRYILRPKFMVQHFWRHAGFYWHNPDVFWSLLGIHKVF